MASRTNNGGLLSVETFGEQPWPGSRRQSSLASRWVVRGSSSRTSSRGCRMNFASPSANARSAARKGSQVDPLTLEVNFVAQIDREVRGGLDLKIITAGGSQTYQAQQVHKIVLELAAVPMPLPGSGEEGDLLAAVDLTPRFRPREE